MITYGLLVSWGLVLLAFVSGIAGLLSKPVREHTSSIKEPLWKRVTLGGWVSLLLLIPTLVLAGINVYFTSERERQLDEQVEEIYSGLLMDRERARTDRQLAAGEYQQARAARRQASEFRDDAKTMLESLDDNIAAANRDLTDVTTEMNNLKNEAAKFRTARDAAAVDLETFVNDIGAAAKKVDELKSRIPDSIDDLFR